ncbi:MAG: hypothetical protein KDA41_21720, partial [Planctomycetales bacterium]|nr:hypothetical protein [Planctomycetales bacterium]
MVRRLFLLLVGVLAAASFRPANAQQSLNTRVVPRDDYFLAQRGYYGGDYATALRAFRSVANGGISSTEGRWVDSICYHTMLGESYYHLGQSTLALEQYEAALKLAVAHGDWLLRVQFPDAIAPASLTNRNRITWGASARRSRTGAYPDTMMSFQGRLNNDNVIRNGGVVTPPNLFPLRVTEIVRCTGLSLYRRWELIGPAGAYTPLSSQIVETLSRRSAPANHWSQVWIEAQLGLAQAGAGKRAEAVAHLQRAI